MQSHHWLFIIAAIVAGYALGVKFPAYGNKLGL